MQGSILITNIGCLVSGDIENSVLDADALLVKDGKIARLGKGEEIGQRGADRVIDANEMVLTPGFIDSHAHMVVGDWTPRLNCLGWMEACLHGGVTTMLSKGENHIQGHPNDPAGVKALAILNKKLYDNFRPGGGLKVHGGALTVVEGLREDDFRELAEEGCWLLAEIGVKTLARGYQAQVTKWARKYGMKVPMHAGGAGIPGCMNQTAEDIIAVNPDIVAHINGGPTALSPGDIERLVCETNYPLEVVGNGNTKAMLKAVQLTQEKSTLQRIHIGSEMPTSKGIVPPAILHTLIQISSLIGIPASKAIAMATGNTARIYGLKTGLIEEGLPADLLIMDCPPGSVGKDALEAIEAGDSPGIAMIMVDGKIISFRGRNTPQTTKAVKIDGIEKKYASLEEYLFGVTR